jgi:PadR family transcriptional regulator, regulatory protein PadR
MPCPKFTPRVGPGAPEVWIVNQSVDDRSMTDLWWSRMELRTPSYFALAALIDGPLHGYGIIRRAEELSGGTVRLSTGTLYALLERAIREELVVAGEPYMHGGRQRRDYELTPAGRTALSAEAKRLDQAARLVERRLRATAATGVAG